jgi:hypothetical protein
MEVSDQRQAPVALFPGEETPVPVGQDTAWAPEGGVEKYPPLPRIEPQ